MAWWRGRRAAAPTFIVQTDAATTATRDGTGLGVLVRDEAGQIVRWACRRAPGMSNNAAEYAALCWALELLATDAPQVVHVYSDSEVLINQMRGRFRVLSAELRPWHQRASDLARRFPRVTFTHIPRERNGLADALANEALQLALPPPERGDG